MRSLYRRLDVGDAEPLPVALLRAPAAVIAAAFVVGTAAGAVAIEVASAASSPATYVLTVLICAPFLLPTAWYRRHRALWLWMACAAAFATMRAVFMAGFLLPHQTPVEWLIKASMDMLAASALCVATVATKRP